MSSAIPGPWPEGLQKGRAQLGSCHPSLPSGPADPALPELQFPRLVVVDWMGDPAGMHPTPPGAFLMGCSLRGAQPPGFTVGFLAGKLVAPLFLPPAGAGSLPLFPRAGGSPGGEEEAGQAWERHATASLQW